ncbi:MAG: fusaric acid resistance protein [Herbaspirillum sp.]|nr:fusaric acid resistance protein [Herbaspirillum sp.]
MSRDADSVSAMSAIPAALADWRKTEGHRWLFVVKILTIAFVALWLAYRLELNSPSTAVTTVFIVALPSSGMVLEKAFFRIIGTLVGCSAAVVLVALLPQAAPLLFVCLAIWIGLCTCGAALFRNSKSYGFLLAGYTACLIVIPAVDAPSGVFTLAITRVTEVGLGILCSAFISDALFPRHHSDLVMHVVSERYERFVALCRDTLENKLAPAEAELLHLRFAADVAFLETARSAAFFEATHTYSESRNLNLFNTASMAALTTFYTLHRLLHRMRQNSSAKVSDLTEALCRCFLSALDPDLAPASAQASRLHIKERAERLRKELLDGEVTPTERIGLDTIIELLARFAENIYELQVVYFALAQKKRLPYRALHSYAPRTPFPIVLASGLRASIALLIFAAMWYYLAWSYAAVAMLMTVVFTALAASAPNPPKMIRQIVTGFVIGVPAAFICDFFLMTHAEGFPMLVLCIVPFVALGTYLTAIPKYAGIGLGLNIFLTQMIFPDNAARIEPAVFLNNAIALVLGGSLAWLVHRLIFPRHTVGRKDYIVEALWREALRTCTSVRIESPQRFDHRIRDLLNQLNAAAGPAPDAETRAVVGRALTLLELGHAVINMREVIAAAPATDIRVALQDCIARIAVFLRAPTAQHRSGLMDAVTETGRLVREAKPSAAPERLARLNLGLANLHCLYTLMLDHEQLMQTTPQTTLQTPEGDHRVA